MRSCPTCDGFVPDRATACPNCRRPSRVGWLAAAIATGAAAVTLMACYGIAAIPPDACADQDGDGYLPACYAPDHKCDPGDRNCDCDDENPAIHPGAFDPIDGVDRDCDGTDGQRPGWTPDAWVQDDAPAAPDAAP